MNVLVTGGAGFIGSNFVRYLRHHRPEWRIVVYDALTYAGNITNLEGIVDDHYVTFIRGDITDKESVDNAWRDYNFELVINFAAESHVDRSIDSASAFVRSNILGVETLLSAAKRYGVTKFIQISTDEVYGSLGETGVFYETTPLDPTSPYAASKAGGDLLALSFYKTHKVPVVITRCTNNYGPFQHPEKFIPLFVTNALLGKPLPLYGDGRNVRSWVHVDDHSCGVLAVCERGRVGEVYNIGPDDAEVPNIAVAESIVTTLGVSMELIQPVKDRLAHDRRYAVSYEKIASELGFKPKISFAEGLGETIKWYRSNESWWKKESERVY
jgi:dTDP-glucose 4,6-dehydratase